MRYGMEIRRRTSERVQNPVGLSCDLRMLVLNAIFCAIIWALWKVIAKE
jgi:hypothetical protein